MGLSDEFCSFRELVDEPFDYCFPVMSDTVVSAVAYSDVVLLQLNVCS